MEAVNAALDEFAGTVTVEGTETAELLDVTLMLTPPLGADPLSTTVQRSVPAPVIEALAQLNPLRLPLIPN